MKKYKQTFIPSVSTGIIKNSIAAAKEYYAKNLQGKSVKNIDTGFEIKFTSDGKRKLSSKEDVYTKKTALLQCLRKLLEVAEFNNFGQRKEKDKQSVLGYLNFKAKAKIDNKIENIRIAVTVKVNEVSRTREKSFYNYEINKIEV